jgi:hypothetical protein
VQEELIHIEDELESPRTIWTGVEFPGSRDNIDPITPLRKRRKVSIPQSHKPGDAIAISSSPDPDEQFGQHSGDEHMPSDEDRHADHGCKHVASSPDLVTPPMPTRFRTPVTKAEVTKPATSKPSFRPFAKDKHLAAESTLALPDAFSPSRRKGRRDYLYGGLADTVRNWVLNAATEESHHHPRLERMIDVEEAVMDPSGRAIVAISSERERWLLVGVQGRGTADALASMLETIRGRGKVMLKGSSTNWLLPIKDADGRQVVHVATQWDAG